MQKLSYLHGLALGFPGRKESLPLHSDWNGVNRTLQKVAVGILINETLGMFFTVGLHFVEVERSQRVMGMKQEPTS